jgi:hypothetical protein
MRITRIAGALLATFGLISTAGAAGNLPEGWSQPTVAHDGVRVMSVAGQGSFESAYRYAPPGKERQEFSQEGMSLAMIIRQDLGLAWTLLPGNVYMEMSIDDIGEEAAKAPTAKGVTSFEKLGTETVNGWPTTRYRVVMKEDGAEGDGYFWLTEHWIPIRMEITTRDETTQTVTMEIRDLRIREQDAAMFELPPGATRMAGLEGLGSIFSGASGEGEGYGFAGELAEGAAETARDTAKQETQQGVKDAVREGVRGLFKR